MKIEEITLSRHFMRDDGTEETITLKTSTPLLHESAVKDAITQLRVELEQFDDTGEIVDDIRAQTESARSELNAILRQIETANEQLSVLKGAIADSGLIADGKGVVFVHHEDDRSSD